MEALPKITISWLEMTKSYMKWVYILTSRSQGYSWNHINNSEFYNTISINIEKLFCFCSQKWLFLLIFIYYYPIVKVSSIAEKIRKIFTNPFNFHQLHSLDDPTSDMSLTFIYMYINHIGQNVIQVKLHSTALDFQTIEFGTHARI